MKRQNVESHLRKMNKLLDEAGKAIQAGRYRRADLLVEQLERTSKMIGSPLGRPVLKEQVDQYVFDKVFQSYYNGIVEFVNDEYPPDEDSDYTNKFDPATMKRAKSDIGKVLSQLDEKGVLDRIIDEYGYDVGFEIAAYRIGHEMNLNRTLKAENEVLTNAVEGLGYVDFYISDAELSGGKRLITQF